MHHAFLILAIEALNEMIERLIDQMQQCNGIWASDGTAQCIACASVWHSRDMNHHNIITFRAHHFDMVIINLRFGHETPFPLPTSISLTRTPHSIVPLSSVKKVIPFEHFKRCAIFLFSKIICSALQLQQNARSFVRCCFFISFALLPLHLFVCVIASNELILIITSSITKVGIENEMEQMQSSWQNWYATCLEIKWMPNELIRKQQWVK